MAAAAGLYLPGTWDSSPDPAPVFNPVPLASNFAALRAAQAIVAALIVREKGGPGQRLEVPLFDSTFESSSLHTSAATRGRVSHDAWSST